MPNGRNIRVLTTPGRSVQFFGGEAKITSHVDMPFMLQYEGARVQPDPGAMPWVYEWLGSTDQIKAEVEWPEGWSIEHLNRFEWSAVPPPGQEVVLQVGADGDTTDASLQPDDPQPPPDAADQGWDQLMNPDDTSLPPDQTVHAANRRRAHS